MWCPGRQTDLQHQQPQLHHMVKIAHDHPVQFSLSVVAAFDGRPSLVGGLVLVQPLLPSIARKAEDGETGEEDGLNLDDRVGRAAPLWESRNIVSERGVIDLVNKNAKESCGVVARIGLELGVDLDDGCGGDCREQTGLHLRSGEVYYLKLVWN